MEGPALVRVEVRMTPAEYKRLKRACKIEKLSVMAAGRRILCDHSDSVIAANTKPRKAAERKA